MSPQRPTIRWFEREEMERTAEQFLETDHPSRAIPAPIEQIAPTFHVSAEVVERRLKWDGGCF